MNRKEIKNLAMLPAVALAQGCPGGYGSGGWLPGSMMGYGPSGGFFGGIILIVFWVLVFVALFYLIRQFSRNGAMGKNENAEDILKKRYAKGEITKEQYVEMKKSLEKM